MLPGLLEEDDRGAKLPVASTLQYAGDLLTLSGSAHEPRRSHAPSIRRPRRRRRLDAHPRRIVHGVFEFDAVLWKWDARDAWYFVTVPDDVSAIIEAQTAGPKRGFGSVRVKVTVGGSTWATSVFPDSKSQCYVLPVKKAVRVAEALEEDGPVSVTLLVVD